MSLITDTSGFPPETPALPAVSIWRLSVDQYHEMIRTGILTEDDPLELLDGWLVRKMPKNPPHCLATGLVEDALRRVAPEGWHVAVQDPITLPTSEPEPDAVVVRGSRRDYVDRHPGPSDVALIVEVADDSLPHDRTFKNRLYAGAGIPVYWIVHLVDGRLEVYTDPSGPEEQPDYRSRRDYTASEEVPVLVAGREVARLPVRALLP